MIAASFPPPVQLCLDLVNPQSRRGRSLRSTARSYWDSVDLADVGGDLHARNRSVRVILSASRRPDHTWLGSYDLLLGDDGTSGVTRLQVSRQDAIASAAYCVARHCQMVLDRGARSRGDSRGASEVLRWMTTLDLL
jgi:hypothetical protein